MFKKKNEVTEQTSAQDARKPRTVRAFAKEGKLLFILLSCERKIAKSGKEYFVATYASEYKSSGSIKERIVATNSAVDLSQFIGKQVLASVKITERWDYDKKRNYENYFITEARLTKAQPAKAA